MRAAIPATATNSPPTPPPSHSSLSSHTRTMLPPKDFLSRGILRQAFALRVDSHRGTADLRLRFSRAHAPRIAAQSNPMRRDRLAERPPKADAPARQARAERTAPGF